MALTVEPYLGQQQHWPDKGHHILAQFDEKTVVVYQAYRPAIGNFAASNGYFGGEFRLNRMSWIKPNFLWMMYRCGWGEKPGQEVVLAVTIQRKTFDDILEQAVYSSFKKRLYTTHQQWQQAVKQSSVRLQWDPDHDPHGNKLPRRAIQLGLRRDALEKYAREWIVAIEDISEFVAEQRENARSNNFSDLLTPRERVYPVENPATARYLGISRNE